MLSGGPADGLEVQAPVHATRIAVPLPDCGAFAYYGTSGNFLEVKVTPCAECAEEPA